MDERNGWHLDRKVPIGLILAIAVQTAMFAYFLGELSETVDSNQQRLLSMEARETVRGDTINDNTIAIAVINQNLVEIQHSLDRIEKNQERLRGD